MIRMNDFAAEPQELIAAQVQAVERVIRSGWYILGAEVNRFEEAFARWAHLPRVAAVGNGMDAIEIGLRAAGIGPGAEVITTPMTAFASVLAILRSGAVPVLADIDPESANLDPHSVERCLTPRTKAVLLVHLYGRLSDMDAWTAFCSARGISLLEDCAQSHGARWNGRPAGTFGVFGAFSFYPTKNLGALGDGGAVALASVEMDRAARELRNYGQAERYRHARLGLNSRLDEMQAAILSERMAWVDRFIQRRRQVARRLDEGIRNPLVRPLSRPADDLSHVHHLYVVRCRDRERLQAYLRERGIETLIHYPVCVHQQEPTRNLARDPHGLPEAEQHAETCLSLPCHPQMTDEDAERVVETINSYR